MNVTSSSDNVELKTFYLSLNENHRRLIQESTLDFVEKDKDNLSNECDYCSKIFLSKSGLNYHINMHHPNQSIHCSECNITFRSHRALKNHQQRLHSQSLPNYNHISSYLVVPFSTQQFPLITKHACEQGRLPLGKLTSKLFQCHLCYLSFPCSNALNYHLLNRHEQYEYNLCKTILYEIILEVEQNLRTVNDENDIDSIKFSLSKQASQFGLVDKQLAGEFHCKKQEQNRFIYPSCQHQNRTCANLCLKYLSSYDKLIHNDPYKISTLPKGNPFTQGSIVSKPINNSIIPKENLNVNQKRTSLKRVKSSISDDSSLPQSKKKFLSQQFKTNDTKSVSVGQSLFTATTSTRVSSKNSRQQTITSLKRSVSPTITLAVERSSEKRRRQREKRKAKRSSSSSSSTVVIKIDDDIEQENDEDEVNIISIEGQQPKQKRRNRQRQASNSSVEYVQVLNNDQQSILKSKINDEEILICNSPSPVKKINPSSNKNHSKTSINNVHKINGHQASDYDEHIRVRCKICGEILEGRSRFSNHVLTMHSHLLKNNMSDMKQQQTTTVR